MKIKFYRFGNKRSIGFHNIIYVFIALTVFISFAQAQVLYRISEAVGDTVDLAERNQYGLFPGIKDFMSVRFLIETDSAYIAEVGHGTSDSVKTMRLRLTSNEVTRIKFLVENPKLIEERRQVDTIASNAVLRRFWSAIEARRIPDSINIARQAKKGDKAAWIIGGTTVGVTVGQLTAAAVVGAAPGVMRVTGTQDCFYSGTQQTSCASCFGPPEPIYAMNLGTYYLVTGLITGAGCASGVLMNELTSKKPSLNIQKVKRSKWGRAIRVLTWFYGPQIGLGLMVGMGYAIAGIINSSEDKKVIDPIELALPLGLFGFGVTYELIRFGCRWADAVDRHEALKKTRRP